MFCPKCGNEKREEFTICPVCNVPLVEELPLEPEPEYIEFVTVFSGGTPADIALVKSIMENADIQYFAKHESVQDIIGWGRFGIGYNPVVGPVEIQVGEDDVEKARELLKELAESEPEDIGQEMRELISTLSDEELYEMLELKPQEYIPEAINIAKEEAVKRGGLELIKQRLGR